MFMRFEVPVRKMGTLFICISLANTSSSYIGVPIRSFSINSEWRSQRFQAELKLTTYSLPKHCPTTELLETIFVFVSQIRSPFLTSKFLATEVET